MEVNHPHDLQDLFAQLGLPNDPASVRAFVACHRPLAQHLLLAEAPFWTPSQAAFLREQAHADSDWALVVDTLNAQLRKHPKVDDLAHLPT